MQVSQIAIYPAYFAAYESANHWQRIILILSFPLIKYGISQTLRWLSRRLQDFAEEVSVSGIEICASIYQSMIMQSTLGILATVLVISIDVLQGIAAVKYAMDKRSVVPRHEIIPAAITYHANHQTAPDFDRYASQKRQVVASIVSIGYNIVAPNRQPSSTIVLGPTASEIIALQGTHPALDHQNTVLVHALALLQAAEIVLLTEYLEVAIPLVTGVYLASQLPSAEYNTKLYDFYFHPDQLPPALLIVARQSEERKNGDLLSTWCVWN